MDFFGAQDRAKRKTGQLVVLFAFAVLGIIAIVYIAVVATLSFVGGELDPWNGDALALVGGGTLLVVGGGTVFRTMQLRSGGPAVAQMLGGRRVSPSTIDLQEKTLFNVVEEMALASGVPMPEVYVLDHETGINAFAAGHTTADAVVAVTRGTIEQLSRDELQGVIGHEFSHVLNADMRLNIRLMAVLFGITCIATAGYLMMRAATESRGSSSSKKGNGVAQIFAIGLVLYVIGSLGKMFASLIKAAVSRQREFLADAAAVQFTRNPRGIASALAKIGGLHSGGRVGHAQASEASHLFFADALTHSFTSWFATHPPIADRVRAIEPLFGRYPVDADSVREKVRAAAPARREAQARERRGPLPQIPGMPNLPGNIDVLGGVLALTPEQILGAVGTLDGERLEATHDWLASVPAALRAATNDPFSASALVFAMLLDRGPELRRVQMAALARNSDASTLATTQDLAREVDALPVEARLPLFDLALPALRAMSREQYARFIANVDALIAADQHVSVFEFALARALHRHLTRAFAHVPAPRPQFNTLIPVLREAGQVLSALAHGCGNTEAAGRAYAAGAETLPRIESSPLPGLVAAEQCGPDTLGPALERLARTTPRAKQQLMRAAARVVAHDGRAHLAELELLRAIADSIDVPVPPLGLAS